MPLQLKALRMAARKIVNEERATMALRTELARALGPSVIVDGPIDEFVYNVNERLDVLECTDRMSTVRVKPSVLHGLVEHSHPGVRKIVARLIGELYVQKFVNDASIDVLTVVAKRAPLAVVSEVVKRAPRCDQIMSVYRMRLKEAGMPNAKPVKEPFDMYGEKRLGDASKTAEEPELTDTWYEQRALKIFHDYGHDNLEYNWEETYVNNYCNALKHSSHVEVDKDKLLKAVKDVIEQHEDLAEKRDAMKETLERLNQLAFLNEATIPLPGIESDPVAELARERLSPHEYITRVNELFCVRESIVPRAIRKYNLGEGNSKQSTVPAVAVLPHNNGLRAIDEQVLTTYVRLWNDKQASRGEPIKIDWVPDPMDVRRVSFTVTLR